MSENTTPTIPYFVSGSYVRTKSTMMGTLMEDKRFQIIVQHPELKENKGLVQFYRAIRGELQKTEEGSNARVNTIEVHTISRL